MSAILDRWLTRLYRLVGGALFLLLCGSAAYRAGDRHRPDPVGSPDRPTPEVRTGGVRAESRPKGIGPEGGMVCDR